MAAWSTAVCPKFAFVLAVVTILIAGFSTTADALYDGWVLSDVGQSCNTVCSVANGNQPCFLASMKAVTTVATFTNILARLGNPLVCARGVTKQYGHSPSINIVTNDCYYNSVSSTCEKGDGLPSNVKRFCCCSASGCPLTKPIACTVSNWAAWGTCSATACASAGVRARTRSVASGPFNGGSCDDALVDTQVCNTAGCFNGWVAAIPNQSCTQACVGKSSCHSASIAAVKTQAEFDYVNVLLGKPVTCTKYHLGSYPHAPSFLTGICYINGGIGGCDLQFLAGNRFCCCSTGGCPVTSAQQDCEVSDWTDWSASTCTATCGTGIQFRYRSVTQVAANGGLACPVLKESQSCNTAACPINCKVSVWNVWGTCSATCDSGTQTRIRQVLTEAVHGGTACPTLTDTSACTGLPACPVDCSSIASPIINSATYSTWLVSTLDIGGTTFTADFDDAQGSVFFSRWDATARTFTQVGSYSYFGLFSLSSFSANGKFYFAATDGIELSIFKYSSSPDAFTLWQTIRDPATLTIYHTSFFTLGADFFMFVSSEDYGKPSKIFQYNSQTDMFAEAAGLVPALYGAKASAPFTINSDKYLAVCINQIPSTLMSIFNTNSIILKYATGSGFTQVTSFATQGCNDISTISLGSITYLAVANRYSDAGSFDINSAVYAFDGSTVSLVQNIATHNAQAVDTWSSGSDRYLFMSQQDAAPELYKWNTAQAKFILVQTLTGTIAIDAKFFNDGSNNNVIVAPYNRPTKVYEWCNGQLSINQ
jgi:hypothetical protein